MGPRFGLESTRGIAARNGRMEKVAPAPSAATCLSIVLRERPQTGISKFAPDGILETMLLSRGSAIRISLHSCAEENFRLWLASAALQKPRVGSSSAGGRVHFFVGRPSATARNS